MQTTKPDTDWASAQFVIRVLKIARGELIVNANALLMHSFFQYFNVIINLPVF